MLTFPHSLHNCNLLSRVFRILSSRPMFSVLFPRLGSLLSWGSIACRGPTCIGTPIGNVLFWYRGQERFGLGTCVEGLWLLSEFWCPGKISFSLFPFGYFKCPTPSAKGLFIFNGKACTVMPLPYLTPSCIETTFRWSAFACLPKSKFARFVAIAQKVNLHKHGLLSRFRRSFNDLLSLARI